jgi:rhodanese-related sulfurtransferase
MDRHVIEPDQAHGDRMPRIATTITRLIVLVLALAPTAACGSSPGPALAASTAMPLEVTVAVADQLRQSGSLILDVRQPDEWATGHIEGATLIPLGELQARSGELPRDRSIVVVCRSGNRSAQGRDILLAAGFTQVTSLAGGMTDWIAAGLPVVTGT